MPRACHFVSGGHFTDLADWGEGRRIKLDHIMYRRIMQVEYMQRKNKLSRDERVFTLQTLFLCKYTFQCYSVLSRTKVFPNVISKKVCHFSYISLWPSYH